MKLLLLIAALSVAQAGDVAHPELAEIKTVYLLPMSNSLDQFLAIRLTRGGMLQVVTDPKLADAIISDHIGTGLEDKLKSIYGEKKSTDPVKEDTSKDAKDAKDKDKDAKDKDKDKDKDQPAFSNPMAGSSRSKGAVFLVDRKTRSVLWSAYVRPKNAQPDELNHVADKVAGQLEKDKRGK
jgi:hypothetical protein